MEDKGTIFGNDEEAVEDDFSEQSSGSDDDDDDGGDESDEGSFEGTEDNEEGESETDDSSSSSDNDPDQDQEAENDAASSSPYKKQKRKAAEIESDSSSDDDHKNGERTPKCPICLNRLSKSLVASPDSGCIHNFCLECLREWSKNNNTCPIDRSEFYFIIIKSNISEEELTREEVKREKQTEDPLIIQDVTLCEVCGSGDREESLLLCDGCDLGYHLDCCNPPLQRVPRGLWYCMSCSAAGLISDYIRLGHCLDYADDQENGFESQALPRTMIIERIRRVIRGRQFNKTGAGPSRQIRKRGKARRKLKATKKQQSAASSSLTAKPKQTRHKSKKIKLSKKSLRKKEKREKRHQEQKTEWENCEREGHFLTLFGRANDLDFYGDEELFVGPESGSASGLTSNLVPSTSMGCSNSVVTCVEQQMNFLEDILNAQSNFFTETSTCHRTEISRNEVYTRPDLEKEKLASNERPYLLASASKKHQDDQPDNYVSEESNSFETSLESPSDSGSPKFSSSTGTTQWRPTEIKAANRFHLGSFRIPRRHADSIKKEAECSEEFQFKVPLTRQKNVEEPTKRPAPVENNKLFSEEPRRSWKKSRSSDHDSRSSRDTGNLERSNHVEKSRHKISEHHHTNSRLPSTSSSRKQTRGSSHSMSLPGTGVKGDVVKERHESRTSRTRPYREKESTDRPDTHRLPDQNVKPTKVADTDSSDHPLHSSSESKTTNNKARHKPKSSTSPRSEKPQDLPGFVIHLVKLALAPHYEAKTIPKDIFKVIVRKSSDKVLSREKSISSVQESKVRQLVEAYVDRYKRKGTV